MKSWLKRITTDITTALSEWTTKWTVKRTMRSRRRRRDHILHKQFRHSKPPWIMRMLLFSLLIFSPFSFARSSRRNTARRYTASMAQQAVAFQARHNFHESRATFDTDSGPVGIDNRCSACMSHVIQDFEDTPRPTNRVIKGFGGSRTKNVMVGTLKWKIEDDDGAVHTFRIPNSYYVPHGGVRLLSPQHWAQHQKDSAGTGSETLAKTCTLFWKQRQHKRTIPLSVDSNVATINLAPGFSKYHAFCTEAEIPDDEVEDPITFESNVVSDDEEDDSDDEQSTFEEENLPYVGIHTDFDLDLDGQSPENQPSIVQDDEEDRQPSSTAAEFLKYHIKYGHCSPKRIRAMAKRGELPRRLAHCDIPICSACQFGKASRKPWRQKTSNNKDEATPVTKPGQVVSVDQLISKTPGLVAQMAGFLTKKRYKVCTVFVDHYSNLGFVHMQASTSISETLEAKEAFERFASQNGVEIQHFHADNGTFAANEWVRDCHGKGQGLTFASVNAHHQNGKAEIRIRNLQDQARAMIIHANKRWPEAVSANLWPYAIRMANDSINSTPWLNDKEGQSPIEKFAKTSVLTNPKHWHHFGCPVFVLDDQLQQGRRPPGGKWKERARIGLYLGRSPQHSRNVALVLNIKTARVSPQFHVKIDSMFHSVKNSTKQERTTSTWLEAAGFGPPKQDAHPKQSQPEPQQPEVSNIPPSEAPVPPSEGAPVEQPMQPPEGARETAPDSEQPASAPAADPTPTTVPTEAFPNRRSNRPRKPNTRLIEVMTAELEDQPTPFEILSLEATFPEPVAYKAHADPDTMYLHQAMKGPDREQFKMAMRKEVDETMPSKRIHATRTTKMRKSKHDTGTHIYWVPAEVDWLCSLMVLII